MNIETLKELMKMCKEDGVQIAKGKPKQFYLAGHIDNPVEFLMESHKNNMEQMKLERERAWNFLIDPVEAEKAGFNAKKQTDQQIAEWAAKAYPKINLSLFENAFEQQWLIKLMREAQV